MVQNNPCLYENSKAVINDICIGDKVNFYEQANVHQQLTYQWTIPLLTLLVSINGLSHYAVVGVELRVLFCATEQLFIQASKVVN